MLLDFLMAVLTNAVHDLIWPNGAGRLMGVRSGEKWSVVREGKRAGCRPDAPTRSGC